MWWEGLNYIGFKVGKEGACKTFRFKGLVKMKVAAWRVCYLLI